MQLVLIDDVVNLGRRGEVVNVAPGYGRNYLIPKGLALPATTGNLKMIEQKKLALAKKESKLKEEAEILAGELNQMHLVISRKAGDTGALFGSVTSKDLVELLEQNGIHLDRKKVLLDHPLKSLGNFNVEVRPHSDVELELMVSVVPEVDEPIEKVLKKGAESDQIIADTQAQIDALEAAEEEKAASFRAQQEEEESPKAEPAEEDTTRS